MKGKIKRISISKNRQKIKQDENINSFIISLKFPFLISIILISYTYIYIIPSTEEIKQKNLDLIELKKTEDILRSNKVCNDILRNSSVDLNNILDSKVPMYYSMGSYGQQQIYRRYAYSMNKIDTTGHYYRSSKGFCKNNLQKQKKLLQNVSLIYSEIKDWKEKIKRK